MTVRLAPVPPCNVAAPSRPNSWRDRVSPAFKAVICIEVKTLTAVKGAITEPASGAPFKRICEDISRESVVLMRYETI